MTFGGREGGRARLWLVAMEPHVWTDAARRGKFANSHIKKRARWMFEESLQLKTCRGAAEHSK